MAVPKKRTSRTRRDIRRSHHALSLPHITVCDNCNTCKRTHHVCNKCGFYRGRQIRAVKQD